MAFSPNNKQNEEEMLTNMLGDHNIPKVIKDQIASLLDKLKAQTNEIMQLREENDYLKATKPCPEYLILPELDTMILERVKAKDLTNVARVQRAWRSKIIVKQHNMSLFPVEQILIVEYESTPVQIKYLKLKGQEVSKVRHVSISEMLKYKPQGFLKIDGFTYSRDNYSIRCLLKQALWLKPSSVNWFKQIKKVSCRFEIPPSREHKISVKQLYYLFLLKFFHLDELKVRLHYRDMDAFVQTIENAPIVDRFELRSSYYDRRAKWDIVLGDQILDAVLRKSSQHPMEFPVFFGRNRFSLGGIIRFLEGNRFTSSTEHRLYLFSHVVGTRDQWMEWLYSNAELISSKMLLPGEEFLGIDGVKYTVKQKAYVKWRFTFRGQKFEVIFRPFIEDNTMTHRDDVESECSSHGSFISDAPDMDDNSFDDDSGGDDDSNVDFEEDDDDDFEDDDDDDDFGEDDD